MARKQGEGREGEEMGTTLERERKLCRGSVLFKNQPVGLNAGPHLGR